MMEPVDAQAILVMVTAGREGIAGMPDISLSNRETNSSYKITISKGGQWWQECCNSCTAATTGTQSAVRHPRVILYH
jgi:hypothetical protein